MSGTGYPWSKPHVKASVPASVRVNRAETVMSKICRIVIEPAGLGRRGQLYRVHYEGTVLLEGTRVPEFDAARALLAKGLVGQVEVWRCGASFPTMRFDCELAAKLTVEESAKSGPRFTLWHPRWEDASANAVSMSGGYARMAKDDGAAVPLADKKLTVLEQPIVAIANPDGEFMNRKAFNRDCGVTVVMSTTETTAQMVRPTARARQRALARKRPASLRRAT